MKFKLCRPKTNKNVVVTEKEMVETKKAKMAKAAIVKKEFQLNGKVNVPGLLNLHSKRIHDLLVFQPDTNNTKENKMMIATASQHNDIKLTTVSGLQEEQVETKTTLLKGHRDWVRSLTIVKMIYDKKKVILLASGGYDDTIRLYRMNGENKNDQTPSLKYTLECDSYVSSLCSFNNILVCGTHIGKIIFFDALKGMQVCEIRAHQDDVNALQIFKMNEKIYLISGSRDETSVKLWRVDINAQDSDTISLKLVHTFVIDDNCKKGKKDDKKGIKTLCVLEDDGDFIIACGEGNMYHQTDVTKSENRNCRLVLFRISDYSMVHTFTGHADTISSLKSFVSPNRSKMLLSCGSDGKVKFWDIEKKKLAQEITSEKSLHSLDCTVYPTGSIEIFAGDNEGNVFVWKGE